MSAVHQHKFIVAFDQADALTSLSVWFSHPTMRAVLEESNVFADRDAARERLTLMCKQAEEDGVCDPGHECGRCANWPPQVWEVALEIVPAD